jgi:hypothetical protein
MTGTPDNNAVWHRTTILVRADILESARTHKTDINGVCNQALADLLGIDLHQQPIGLLPEPVPVLVAPDVSPATPVKSAQEPRIPLHPVINADDPAAVKKVIQAKKLPPVPTAKSPAEEPARGEPRMMQEPKKEAIPVPKSPAKAKVPAGKRGKEDIIKKFVAEKIARGEPDDASVPKDEMYDLFARWCRDQRIAPVPERRRLTIALKNQFALTEKMVAGAPCWQNVRIK